MTTPATDEQIAELEELLEGPQFVGSLLPAILARLRAAEAEGKLSDAETEAIPAGMPVSETQRLRAQTLSETVCDAIWGGEHAWESATDAEFEGLLSEAKSRLYGTEAERIRAEERERGLYAGVLHLLAECSVHMREHEDAEELRDMIELAMEDAAGTGRFQWRRVLNRFEVWPSAQGAPNANK